MALILNIDTATDDGAVGISQNEELIIFKISGNQKEHAAFLQPAIAEIILELNLPLATIDAVALTIGPGSYTGLRVGLASAKGLCFALHKPLICINTLEVMALASIQQDAALKTNNTLYCPMIDARRMEVFTAVYNQQLQIVLPPAHVEINADSFLDQLKNGPIIFSGNGAKKIEGVIKNNNAIISKTKHHLQHLATLATAAYHKKMFADMAYTEPAYLKAFYTTAKIGI